MSRSGTSYGEEYHVDYNRRLGHGSFSEVFIGRIKATGQEVAVKVAQGARGIEAGRKEIDILKKFVESEEKHTNIVKLIGYHDSAATQKEQRKLTFALELGRCSLDVLMKMDSNLGGLEMNIMIDLITDCGSMLKSLRSMCVAHRDIKHLNILVFPGPRKNRRSQYLFKLCDLGGSKFCTDDEGMTTLVGTPNCLHPMLARELAKGPHHKWNVPEKYGGEQCDCWSLGCTLYFAACGRYPFPHASDYSVYYNAVKQLPSDSVSVEVIGLPNRRQGFRNHKYIDNRQYPGWFRHCVSSLIRMLFHAPSFDTFDTMAQALQTSREYSIVSIGDMDVFGYADLSAVPVFSAGYPTIHDTLSISTEIQLCFVSANDIVYYKLQKDVGKLKPGVPYVVFPCTQTMYEYNIKSKPWLNQAKPEDLSIDNMDNVKAQQIRLASLVDAFSALNDCRRMRLMLDHTKTVVKQQLMRLREKIVTTKDALAMPTRFAHYASAQCQALLITSKEDKQHALEGIRSADSSAKEFMGHSKALDTMEQNRMDMFHEIDGLELEEEDEPDVDDELCRYYLSSLEEIRQTAPYTLRLVQSCFDRRSRIADELCGKEREMPVVNLLLLRVRDVLKFSFELERLSGHVTESTSLIEMPFQELKRRSERFLNENQITDEMVERAKSFYNGSDRISQSAGEINALARLLVDKVGGLRVTKK